MSLAGRIFRERRSVVLPVLIFLLLNVAGLGGVFWLQQSIDAAKASRDQALLDLDKARKDETKAKGMKGSKELADVELRKFYGDVLPRNLASAVNVLNFWLSKIAASSKVAYHAGQYDHDPVRDSQLTKVTGSITLTGSYADVRRFLYELETSQEFIVIEKVGLSQATTTQANSPLELNLSVATYFLTEGLPGVVSK
jgi:Tfp pilus assembly protein PilO